MAYTVTINGTSYSLPEANERDWASKLQSYFQAVAGLLSGTSAGTWIAPTLSNSWVDYGAGQMASGYRRDATGRVWLRGLIKDGTATSGTTLFTLPAGYRPSASLIFVAISNGAIGEVRVNSAGAVQIYTGSNTSISLDGISFDTLS